MAQGAGGAQAVKAGHLHVHQHQVVVAGAQPVQRLQAVAGHVGLQAHALQQVQRHLLVQQVVVDHQQPAAGVRPPLRLVVGLGRAAATGCGVGQWHGALARRQRQLEAEAAAAARHRGGGEHAAHRVHQRPADRQAQPGAAEAPGGRAVGLLERLEDAGALGLVDADAGVGHLEAHHVAGAGVEPQADLAGFGELHCVAQQVEQHLAQPQVIAVPPQR